MNATRWLTRLVNKWTDWLQEPRWLVGAGLVRIAFGTIVFAMCALQVARRDFLWGPNGFMPWDDFLVDITQAHQLNVFALSSSELAFNIIFFVGFALTICFTVGYKTELVKWPFVIFAWSLYHRNPFLMNGGTRLMNILLLYLLFADLRRFSVDEYLSARRGGALEHWPWRMMFHNTAVLACLIQICYVYFFSTFYKIAGEPWRQGTALFYALQLPQFHIGPVAEFLQNNPTLLTIGTYATLLYQSAFPWLVWHPRMRYFMLASAVGFHGMIAISMGLFWFSAVMISSEVLFLTDLEYAKMWAYLCSLGSAPRPWERPLAQSRASLGLALRRVVGGG